MQNNLVDSAATALSSVQIALDIAVLFSANIGRTSDQPSETSIIKNW